MSDRRHQPFGMPLLQPIDAALRLGQIFRTDSVNIAPIMQAGVMTVYRRAGVSKSSINTAIPSILHPLRTREYGTFVK